MEILWDFKGNWSNDKIWKCFHPHHRDNSGSLWTWSDIFPAYKSNISVPLALANITNNQQHHLSLHFGKMAFYWFKLIWCPQTLQWTGLIFPQVSLQHSSLFPSSALYQVVPCRSHISTFDWVLYSSNTSHGMPLKKGLYIGPETCRAQYWRNCIYMT